LVAQTSTSKRDRGAGRKGSASGPEADVRPPRGRLRAYEAVRRALELVGGRLHCSRHLPGSACHSSDPVMDRSLEAYLTPMPAFIQFVAGAGLLAAILAIGLSWMIFNGDLLGAAIIGIPSALVLLICLGVTWMLMAG